MSSPRLNHIVKKAQRQLLAARQRAFEQTIGQRVRCGACDAECTLSIAAYRGIAVRDRVHVDTVRFACEHCGADISVKIDQPGAG